MKKLKLIILVVMVLLLCGCMRIESELTIEENGTVFFSTIFATNNEVYGDFSNINDNVANKLASQGYYIYEYDKDNYSGYKVEKNINNIKEISSENITSYNIEKLFYTNDKVFQKNGNKYKAVFKFPEEYILTDEYVIQDSEIRNEYPGNFIFKVNLPNKSLSNNANITENEGKTLIWQFDEANIKDIEFEFEINASYEKENNVNIILIVVGALIILFIISIIYILKKNKKTKNKEMIKEVSINLE